MPTKPPRRPGNELGLLRHSTNQLTRRELLSLMAKGALVYPLAANELAAVSKPQQIAPPEEQLTNDELLEQIVYRAFLFFWNEA